VLGGQASGTVQLHYRLSLPVATLAKLSTNSCNTQLQRHHASPAEWLEGHLVALSGPGLQVQI